MSLPVVFTPEAKVQLRRLYRYIAKASYPVIAARYTEAVVAHCESLSKFPQRGTARDDIRPGLRITHYRRSTAIAFAVQPQRIEIIGIFHGGRDYATRLREQA